MLRIDSLNYKNIFQDLSFEVEKNKFITISGSNNCGKTTLIKILNKSIITDSSIYLNNKNIYDYTLSEYSKLVECIIPLEYRFIEKNLIDEINYYCKNKKIKDYLIKELKLKRLLTKDIKLLTKNEFILAQIVISLCKRPELLLIDSLDYYFNSKELEKLIIFLKRYQTKYNLTIIWTTLSLEGSILSDKLLIINDKKIILDGDPTDVLEKDNIINKSGLNLPFMIDLSIKLGDYDLIDEVELSKNRMINKLWK